MPLHLETVVEEAVGGAGGWKGWSIPSCKRRGATLTDTTEDTAESLRLDGGDDGRWCQRGVQAEQVSRETSNMGGSH